jgi:hypothetical protein
MYRVIAGLWVLPAAVVAALLLVGLANGGEVIDPDPVILPVVAATPRPATALSPPNRFFGTVTVNGDPAPAGTPIVAIISNIRCGSGQVQQGGTYSIDIAPANTVAGCGVDGATVMFTVGDRLASVSGIWAQGAFTLFNLAVFDTDPLTLPPEAPSPQSPGVAQSVTPLPAIPVDVYPPRTSVAIQAQIPPAGQGHPYVILTFTAADQPPHGAFPLVHTLSVRSIEVIEDGERLPCRLRDRCTVRETELGVHVFQYSATDALGNSEAPRILYVEITETGVSSWSPSDGNHVAASDYITVHLEILDFVVR